SRSVGTSGKSGERLAELTVSAVTLRSWMRPRKLPTPKRVSWTSFAASAWAAGPPPLYGPPTILVPHWLLTHFRRRSGDEPSPRVAKLRLSRLLSASALRCAIEPVPSDGCTNTPSIRKNRRAIGTRPASGLYGSRSNRSGL